LLSQDFHCQLPWWFGKTILPSDLKMRILLPLIVSVGLLCLLYRALCEWAQNNMRKAMYSDGQVGGNTAASPTVETELPGTTLQNSNNSPPTY
jgi:hypothetical protein